MEKQANERKNPRGEARHRRQSYSFFSLAAFKTPPTDGRTVRFWSRATTPMARPADHWHRMVWPDVEAAIDDCLLRVVSETK